MCKYSMLAGEGYKRFGDTMNQAVCNILKRYSRFYGVLSEFEVLNLAYRIYSDRDVFYQKIEDDIFSEFLKTHKDSKYDTIAKMRGYARRIGAFKSVSELKTESSYFFRMRSLIYGSAKQQKLTQNTGIPESFTVKMALTSYLECSHTWVVTSIIADIATMKITECITVT